MDPEKETSPKQEAAQPGATSPPASIGVSELRRRALAFGFGAVALGAFGLLLAIYGQLAQPILWAVTLTMLFFPLHKRILILTRGRAGVAAVISTVLALAVVIVPAVFGLIHLIGEVRNLWPNIRDSLGPDAFERIARWIEGSRFRGILHMVLGGNNVNSAEAVQARLAELAFQVQDFLLNQLRHITRSVPRAVVQLGVTILAFYFFLLHGLSWSAQFRAALPLEEGHAQRLFSIANQAINAVFRGVVLTAVVQAVLAGLGYWVAGAPTPILLTLFTLVAALIPFVGPVTIWLPTSVGLYLAGRTGAAIGLGLWGMLVVSLVDNTLRPWFIGRGMKLPLLWLFLAILGGLKLFGFLGIVVGPMSLAVALACYRIYKEERPI